MTAAVPNPAHYLSIHYLRAIAAVMVVAVHVFDYGLVPIDDESLVHWLEEGVAIFFVISGFVMVTSTRGRAIGPAEFMRRRILRVVPLYWVLTLGWLAYATDWDIGHLASSLMFLPSPDPVTGVMRSPILEPGWSLNFEMFFYLVFAAVLILPEKLRLWSVAIALVLFLQSAEWFDLPPNIAYFASQNLLLFVAGMALARFNLRLPVWASAAGFAGLAVAPQFTDNFILCVFVPAVAIVAGARSLDGHLRKWQLPSLLADASYAIYLSHLFTLQVCSIFVAPYLPGPVALVVILALSCAVGILVHRRIENPLTDLCKRGFSAFRTRAVQPAA